MKFAELIPLTAAVVNLALTIFVLTRGLKSTLSRVYLLWGASIVVWNLGTLFMFRIEDPTAARICATILQLGVIFLPIALFHLCLLIAQISMPRLLRAMYAFQIALAVSDLSGWFISGVHDAGYAYYSTAGPGFWVFTISYAFLTSFAMVLLYQKLKLVPPLHRVRIKSLLWACGTLVLFGVNDILPILGVYHYPFLHFNIFPFGSLAAIGYGLLVGYSALQHQLLHVQVALSRVIAHGIRLAFMTMIALVLLLIMVFIVPDGTFNWLSFVSALGVVLISASPRLDFFPASVRSKW